ncbi:MAG: phosphoglucomutase [Desulfobulbaceae bacterium]|uniref:Phosphoglucomutase n=1 Tax=Candidatus Desulfatifera sulfidica TaxID=2841691 RepID=A0A8J6NA01_9BACT|nr:phosphoglucomutase [Candidatus Desulfatifera sulfidica]
MMTTVRELYRECGIGQVHAESDYFCLIRKLVSLRNEQGEVWQRFIDQTYNLIQDEIENNPGQPIRRVKFGTSGWRGVLGKDLFVRSVSQVTAAIVSLYEELETDSALVPFLGVASLAEARQRGCVLGFDNRFGGVTLAAAVAEVLRQNNFVVHYAGESATGVLSAALLELNGAFSINLTPSHNPLEYGGFKYNAADAGPAASELTDQITMRACEIIATETSVLDPQICLSDPAERNDLQPFDSFSCWRNLVRSNVAGHGLALNEILEKFTERADLCVAVDSVHGSSRLHLPELLATGGERFIHLRSEPDVTFGGVAPEPSSVNMQGVMAALAGRAEPLKLGAIIDPDGDRIRFCDGNVEISMNQFGAMAYHFLHEIKGKNGMVAKTVATSNMANGLARAFGEDVYEPRVGFKEFKPVIGQALVCFEESDGITVIGHTPEKDAYIGLLLAVDMVQTLGINLGEYLRQIEEEFGACYPDRDGVEVSLRGGELLACLASLQKHAAGTDLRVGEKIQRIVEVIDIDGRKMILDDGSWLMIRPSGTEPKVRFYVEGRTAEQSRALVASARELLAEIGLL